MAETGVRHGTAELADVIRPEVVIRRTAAGWVVEGPFPRRHGEKAASETLEDLHDAMVLADLLAPEVRPAPRPPRPSGQLDETGQLRLAVRQLEHGLAARVLIEQAIGVLAERWRTTPRSAFEQLRRSARSHGRRVHDLAGEVVASTTDRSAALPADLVPPPAPEHTEDGAAPGSE